jgi:hypothetical protein
VPVCRCAGALCFIVSVCMCACLCVSGSLCVCCVVVFLVRLVVFVCVGVGVCVPGSTSKTQLRETQRARRSKVASHRVIDVRCVDAPNSVSRGEGSALSSFCFVSVVEPGAGHRSNEVSKAKMDVEDIAQEILVAESVTGHPHTVCLVDAWCFDGIPNLVFLFGGQPLQLGNATGVREGRRLVRQIASGLGHMHSKMIIHNDLKPANILVGAGGHIRIADFGASRIDREGWSPATSERDIVRAGAKSKCQGP